MKKIIILLSSVILCAQAFCFDLPNRMVTVHASVPYIREFVADGYKYVDATWKSVGAGVSDYESVTDWFGFYVQMDLIMPLELSMEMQTSEGKRSGSVASGSFSTLFGYSALMGPAFILQSSSNYRTVFATGGHYTFIDAKMDDASLVNMLWGFGVKSDTIFQLSSNVYLNLGCLGAIDYKHPFSNSSTSDDVEFTIQGEIGVGFAY